MFEDLITSKPKITGAKLEKNGVMLENAVVNMSNYIAKGQGYMICDGLVIEKSDEFRIHILYKKHSMISITVIASIYLTRLSDGRIKFSIGV
jgi:hypothetical protein